MTLDSVDLENTLAGVLSLPKPQPGYSAETISHLAQALLSDRSQAIAFGITADNSRVAAHERLRLLHATYPALTQLCQQQLRWKSCPLAIAWTLWLPLAIALATARRELDRPLIQGILGGQGTGKTTLAAVLTVILTHLGHRVCALSLDDLYKTYAQRQQLQQHDPRLIWRGPPGTHDVDLGLAVLQALRQGSPSPVALPRFDKSAWQGAGDRTTPELVSHIDIVLFEGWFVGARPIDPAQFDHAPSPIDSDCDRQFARDCNARLHDYLPLWDLLDRLMVLHPVDYRLSQQWRREAEQRMVATGKAGMSDEQLQQFVHYFWRSLHPLLFIQPMLHDPRHVDWVIDIDANHAPIRIYRPNQRDQRDAVTR